MDTVCCLKYLNNVAQEGRLAPKQPSLLNYYIYRWDLSLVFQAVCSGRTGTCLFIFKVLRSTLFQSVVKHRLKSREPRHLLDRIIFRFSEFISGRVLPILQNVTITTVWWTETASMARMMEMSILWWSSVQSLLPRPNPRLIITINTNVVSRPGFLLVMMYCILSTIQTGYYTFLSSRLT